MAGRIPELQLRADGSREGRVQPRRPRAAGVGSWGGGCLAGCARGGLAPHSAGRPQGGAGAQALLGVLVSPGVPPVTGSRSGESVVTVASAASRSPKTFGASVTMGGGPRAAPLPVSSILAEFFNGVAPAPGSEVFGAPPSPKMAAAEEDELLPPRLPELFETSKQLLDEVEVAAEPTGSRRIQEKVLKGLELLNTAAEMISQLDLFRYGEGLAAEKEANNGPRGSR